MSWRMGTLDSLLYEYSPDDIYNADETALFFYKLLPTSTLAAKNDPCLGVKQSRDRVTVLLATNMSGTDKRKPLIIGRFKKPRCFADSPIDEYPITYTASKIRWIFLH